MPSLSDNYFALYGLQPGIDVDEKALRQQYLRLSREFHPDFFAGDTSAQTEALQMSAYNNKAYQTLSEFYTRVQYLLELKGLLGNNEKNTLPPDFLADMMALNEELAELQFDPDEDAKHRIAAKFEQLNTDIRKALHEAAGSDNFDTVKDEFLKLRYLHRIAEQLEGR